VRLQNKTRHLHTYSTFLIAQDGLRVSPMLSHRYTPADRRRSTVSYTLLRVVIYLTAHPKLYGPRQVFIPKMPALGLLLEHPIFESYNRKVGSVNENLSSEDAEFRPLVDFDIHHDEIEKFKQTYIYDRMREAEDRKAV
jgi:hypothetical protein